MKVGGVIGGLEKRPERKAFIYNGGREEVRVPYSPQSKNPDISSGFSVLRPLKACFQKAEEQKITGVLCTQAFALQLPPSGINERSELIPGNAI